MFLFCYRLDFPIMVVIVLLHFVIFKKGIKCNLFSHLSRYVSFFSFFPFFLLIAYLATNKNNFVFSGIPGFAQNYDEEYE